MSYMCARERVYMKLQARRRSRQYYNRTAIYNLIVQRDGERCRRCAASGRETELVIEHMDGNPDNWDAANLSVACKSCNMKLIWEQQQARELSKKLDEHESVTSRLYVRESENESSRGMLWRPPVIDMDKASVEIKLNRFAKQKFLDWLMDLVTDQPFVWKDTLIPAGAWLTSMSITTVERYLREATSVIGPFSEEVFNGRRRIVLRPEYWDRPEKKAELDAHNRHMILFNALRKKKQTEPEKDKLISSG